MPRGTRLTEEKVKAVLDQLGNKFNRTKKALFKEMLFRKKAALAWDWQNCGKIKSNVAPDYEIRTVPHKAWQTKGITVPANLKDKLIEVLRVRIQRGIFEQSYAAYRNAWFLVEKKNGSLQLINSATKLNAVTLRDAFMPENCDEFSADFAMCSLVTLVDFFSGYDQVTLAPASRDLTIFATPLGLFRYTSMPIGFTNFMAHFCRVVGRIFDDLMPDIARPFVDDVGIKGLKTRYDDEEIFPGIRRFVYEHIVNIDKTLINCELAGISISMKKFQWCQKTTVIVGFLCETNRRRPDTAKVEKILEIPPCKNVSELNVIRLNLILTGTASTPTGTDKQGPLIGNWSKESQEYARFLTILDLPNRLRKALIKKKAAFKAETLKYYIQDGILWRKADKRYGSRKVVDTEPRCELSDYLEAKALRSVTLAAIKKFLDKHIFYRHGIPIKIKINGGFENKGEVIKACNALGIQRKVGAAYAAWRQGLVEKGYVPIAKALIKATNGTGKGWVKLLPKMVFADNTTVKSYGLSPHKLLYG
ncbi:hypothetical protein DL770_010482 [Monosporascus sp. CRB-9-2]|nr:hypothetical protein DL770_010482 [Monosporascus sp. CRB-9-2]